MSFRRFVIWAWLVVELFFFTLDASSFFGGGVRRALNVWFGVVCWGFRFGTSGLRVSVVGGDRCTHPCVRLCIGIACGEREHSSTLRERSPRLCERLIPSR